MKILRWTFITFGLFVLLCWVSLVWAYTECGRFDDWVYSQCLDTFPQQCRYYCEDDSTQFDLSAALGTDGYISITTHSLPQISILSNASTGHPVIDLSQFSKGDNIEICFENYFNCFLVSIEELKHLLEVK